MPRHPLSGSERQPIRGARAIGKADPSERLEVSVLLRFRESDALKDRVARLARGERPDRHLQSAVESEARVFRRARGPCRPHSQHSGFPLRALHCERRTLFGTRITRHVCKSRNPGLKTVVRIGPGLREATTERRRVEAMAGLCYAEGSGAVPSGRRWRVHCYGTCSTGDCHPR